MLRMTGDDLAKRSGVGIATIRRYELASGIPPGSARALNALQQALEEAGIEFIGAPDDRPGVRLNGKVLP